MATANTANSVIRVEDSKWRYTLLKMKQNRGMYLLMAPFFILFTIFTLVPVVFSVLLSFVEWNGGAMSQMKWVGLENYADIFKIEKVIDKFADCEELRSDNGLRFLPRHINAFMSLKVEDYVDLGSHGMFICRVTEARVISDRETMSYNYSYFFTCAVRKNNSASNLLVSVT